MLEKRFKNFILFVQVLNSSSLSVLVSIPYDEWLILVMLGGSGLLGN